MHEYKCTIVRVIDGDTVDVDIDLGFGVWMHKERIRLFGIDTPEITKSTKEYMEHIETIQDEAMKLYAHIYVRHMGDLSGGQLIMKKTPGPNRYYKFKHKEVGDYRRIVKDNINTYLNVYEHSVLPEAKMCFESATKLFTEMNNLSPTI